MAETKNAITSQACESLNCTPRSGKKDDYLFDNGMIADEALVGAMQLQELCHRLALHSGWWGGNGKPDPRDNPLCFSNKLCLIHSEVSEAMEGDRKSVQDDKLPHRAMREVELADVVIRAFDLAGAYNMDIAGAIIEKLAYNQKRADHNPQAREAEGGKSY